MKYKKSRRLEATGCDEGWLCRYELLLDQLLFPPLMDGGDDSTIERTLTLTTRQIHNRRLKHRNGELDLERVQFMSLPSEGDWKPRIDEASIPHHTITMYAMRVRTEYVRRKFSISGRHADEHCVLMGTFDNLFGSKYLRSTRPYDDVESIELPQGISMLQTELAAVEHFVRRLLAELARRIGIVRIRDTYLELMLEIQPSSGMSTDRTETEHEDSRRDDFPCSNAYSYSLST